MHEFSVVEAHIHLLRKQLRDAGIEHVVKVRFRRGSTFSEAALRQAFQVTTCGTPLADAQLEIDVVEMHFECPTCSHTQVLSADDLVMHLFTCPKCEAITEIDEHADLELLEVVTEENGSPICYWPD